MATASNLEELLTERDVSRITSLSIATVRRWRLFGQGPRYLKTSPGRRGAVRYRPEWVSEFLESRPTGGGKA